VLKVEKLSVFHGSAQSLFEVSLSVERGEVVALVGRNGAGKSTTLKAIMGLAPNARGTIRYEEQSILGLPTHAIARLGLGYVPEERRIFRDLTVAENLSVGARPGAAAGDGWTLESLSELFPPLAGLMQRRGEQLSGGEQQMLALARTLMGNPRLLLLDEPTEGLAPLVVRQMTEATARLKAGGVSILLSEQNLRFAQAVADRAYLIEAGHIRAQRKMADLLADEELRRRYLAV
jgi:branched-chain amino acid transport system ATP-binding protein